MSADALTVLADVDQCVGRVGRGVLTVSTDKEKYWDHEHKKKINNTV